MGGNGKQRTVKTDTRAKRYGRNGEYEANAVADLYAATRDKGYQPTKEEAAAIDEWARDTGNGADVAKGKPKAARRVDIVNVNNGDYPDLSEGAAAGAVDAGKGAPAEMPRGRGGVQGQDVDYRNSWIGDRMGDNPLFQDLSKYGMDASGKKRGKIIAHNGREISGDDAIEYIIKDAAANGADVDTIDDALVKQYKGRRGDREQYIINLMKEAGYNADTIPPKIDAALRDAYKQSNMEASRLISYDDWLRGNLGGLANVSERAARAADISGTRGAAGGDGGKGKTADVARLTLDDVRGLTLDDVRGLSPEGYQSGSLTARDVVRAMKDGGLSKAQAIQEMARLSSTSETGAMSAAAMTAINGIYGAGRAESASNASRGADWRSLTRNEYRNGDITFDDVARAMYADGADAAQVREKGRELGASAGAVDGAVARLYAGYDGGQTVSEMNRMRDAAREQLLADATEEDFAKAMDAAAERYADRLRNIDPEDVKYMTQSVWSAYKNGLFGERGTAGAKLGLFDAILGAIGKGLGVFANGMGNMAGIGDVVEVKQTPFEQMREGSIDNALAMRRNYQLNRTAEEMRMAGWSPEMEKKGIEQIQEWSANPDTAPFVRNMNATEKMLAYDVYLKIADKLSNEKAGTLISCMAVSGALDGEGLKALLAVRGGRAALQAVSGALDETAKGGGWGAGAAKKAKAAIDAALEEMGGGE